MVRESKGKGVKKVEGEGVERERDRACCEREGEDGGNCEQRE